MTTLTMVVVVDWVDKKGDVGSSVDAEREIDGDAEDDKDGDDDRIYGDERAKMKMEKLKRLSLASSTLLSLNIYSSRRFCKKIIITPIMAPSS